MYLKQFGEIHAKRFRSRRPVDRKDISTNDVTSAETSAGGGDQAPSSRKRKSQRTGKNSDSFQSSSLSLGNISFREQRQLEYDIKKGTYSRPVKYGIFFNTSKTK
jgi:hypothetical protein